MNDDYSGDDVILIATLAVVHGLFWLVTGMAAGALLW